MSSDVMKEYLVALGFAVNSSSYATFRKVLKEAETATKETSTVSSAAVLKASTVIVSAITAITGATVTMIHNLGAADLQYQKFALRMYMSNQSAKELKTTLDALGESLEDAAFIPELRGQFQSLLQQGRAMALPNEYAQQMRDIRAIDFEFKRMKLEVTYGMQWIGFYLMKHLAGPVKSLKEGLKSINDYLTQNMPKWTEKIASGLASIINVVRALWWAISNVAEAVKGFWDSFPSGVKTAIMALTALGAFMLASPVGQFIFVLSTALIMLEDFYGYMNGWKSSKTLAPMWKWLLEILEKIQKKPEIKMLKDAFRELKWALNDVAYAAKDFVKQLNIMDGLGNDGPFAKGFTLWIDDVLWKVKLLLKSLTFIAEIITHTLNGTIGDYLKTKLVDIQNSVNASQGLPQYPGGTPKGAGDSGPLNKNTEADFKSLAKRASEQTGIPAELIYGQWYHETGGFTNWGTSNANNLSGFKQFKSQPGWFSGDAGGYQVFDNLGDYVDYYAQYMNKYVPGDKSSAEGFARALKDAGYYEADIDEYIGGLKSGAGMYGNSAANYRGYGTTRSWGEASPQTYAQAFAPSAESLGLGGGNAQQVNYMTVQIPPGSDAQTYAQAIAKEISPKTTALSRIVLVQQLKEVQGVGV